MNEHDSKIKTKDWTRIPAYKTPVSKRISVNYKKPKPIRINRCPDCGTNLKEFPCLECEINGPH